MEMRTRSGDKEDWLDELTFESMPEPEPGPAIGLVLESLRRRDPTRTIH